MRDWMLFHCLNLQDGIQVRNRVIVESCDSLIWSGIIAHVQEHFEIPLGPAQLFSCFACSTS